MSLSRRLPGDFSVNAAFPLFAMDLGLDCGWVLHFDRDDYHRATFLDQRALHHREIPGWRVSRAELEAALDSSRPQPSRWLFHIGHCGSTLVSRLLDLIPGALGVREPLPLLTLAHAQDDARSRPWLPLVTQLLTRGFVDTKATVVKPTSLVTTIAQRLLPGSGPACLLWVDLQTWLASMLREDSLKDGVLSTEPLRMRDLAFSHPAIEDPQRLARAWLAEQVRWRQLDRGSGTAALCDLDFADVLADAAGATARLAAHYGLAVPEDWAQRVGRSGLLQRYAKNDAQAFDAKTRQRELAAATERHAGAIAEGLAWAEMALRQDGLADLLPRLRPKP